MAWLAEESGSALALWSSQRAVTAHLPPSRPRPSTARRAQLMAPARVHTSVDTRAKPLVRARRPPQGRRTK